VAAQTRSEVSGQTIRWVFEDGPTKGMAFEHEFGRDGSVRYRMAGDGEAKGAKKGTGEVAKYGSARISDDVSVVSYRSANGFTLTVALNFAEHTAVGFASNSDQWFEQRGTFEVVD